MGVRGGVVGWNGVKSLCMECMCGVNTDVGTQMGLPGAQPGQWVWLPRLQLPLPPPQVRLFVFPPEHNLYEIRFPCQGAALGIGSPCNRG